MERPTKDEMEKACESAYKNLPDVIRVITDYATFVLGFYYGQTYGQKWEIEKKG